LVHEKIRTRDVAARAVQTRDEAELDRIGAGQEHNGDSRGRLLRGEDVLCAWGEDDINFERIKTGCRYNYLS
jgi:hypothetical protein